MTALGDEVAMDGWAPSPAVIAAEESVIGHVIQTRAAAESAAELLRPDDFFRSAHHLVFEAVTALVETGQDVDPVGVLGELGRRGTLVRIGGGPTLATFMERAMIGSLRRDAMTVRNDAIRRRIADVGPLIGQLTARGDFDLDADVDVIRKRLEEAVAPVVGVEPPTVGDVLLDVLEELEQPLTAKDLLPPPYQDLETIVPGLRPGHVIVVGGRPSQGKTLLALDWARTVSVRLGLPTLLFSLEMSRTEIMHRLLAAEATVKLECFTKHELTDDDWEKVFKVRDRVVAAPLVIDDAPACTLARIRARLRGMKRRHGGCRLLIVDYLGLMEAPRAETRERSVAETTRALKLLAKEFRLPVILLAQLNRASEHRADRKPMLSDLRESGGIEADADGVILIHREDFYDKETPRAGEMDLIVAKNRHGRTGTAVVAFQGIYGRATDLYRER